MLVQLGDRTNETTYLATLRGADVIYLDSVESTQGVRTGSRILVFRRFSSAPTCQAPEMGITMTSTVPHDAALEELS